MTYESAARAALKAIETKSEKHTSRQHFRTTTATNSLTFSKNITEHRRTQRAVLVEDLVHDIPSVDLPGITLSNRRDVILDHASQSRRASDARNPGRQLRVPDEGMSADEFPVGLGPVDECVETAKVEISLAGLDGIPLYEQKRVSGWCERFYEEGAY